MSTADTVPCEFLPWDTEFFGRRIARVCGHDLTQELAGRIDDWCRLNHIKALYFLSRSDDPLTVQIAGQNGFELVDIRLTFERALVDNSNEPPRSTQAADAGIRPVKAADLPALQALARTAHRDARFFSDPHFPRERAEDLYSTWIALESQGRAQKVFVAVVAADQPVGYLSCHLDQAGREAQIGLVAVGPAARGKGIGKNLVRAAIDWCQTQRAQTVTVVTQGNNCAAQRLYQRCGFLTRDLQLWYHKWYPVSDSAPGRPTND